MNIPAHMTCLSCAHSRGDYRGEHCLLERASFPVPSTECFEYEPGTDEEEREEQEQ